MARNIRFLTKALGAVALVMLSCSPALANLSFPAAKQKDGSPDRRRGAGSRYPGEPCIAGETDVEKERVPFALAPNNNEVLTTSASPDFFWYMPPLTRGDVTFELNESASKEPVYKTTFTASGEEGLARLSLPGGVGGATLEVGKNYEWSVRVTCDPDADTEEFGTEPKSVVYRFKSTVRRLAPSAELTSQLKVASGLKQAEVYAQNGFWEDSLSALAEMQCTASSRDEGLEAWSALLQSVDLEYFSQVPLFDECDCACN